MWFPSATITYVTKTSVTKALAIISLANNICQQTSMDINNMTITSVIANINVELPSVNITGEK